MQCPSVDSNTLCASMMMSMGSECWLTIGDEKLVMFVMGKRNRNYKEGSHNVRDMWGMGPVTSSSSTSIHENFNHSIPIK